MGSIDICGVTVDFPFEPYKAQEEYMESVIRALNTGSNALLESPTGTGKTLCLLCATLAWVQHMRRTHPAFFQRAPAGMSSSASPGGDARGDAKPYRVVYCSRTHAQLAQVIRELKRTAYRERITMALLGSRDHMCVNSEVLRLPSSQAQRSMCNALRADKNCRFFRSLQMKSSAALPEEKLIHDMEDLVVEGKKNGFCPYYYERDQAAEADVVFMPYNYILDPVLRRQLPFDVKQSILIFDEAHNLPSMLSASGCLNLQPIELSNAIHDCSRAIAMQRLALQQEDVNAQEVALAEQEFASLKILLCRFEARIAKEDMRAENSGVGSRQPIAGELVRAGSYFVPFLAEAYITEEVFSGMPGAAGMDEIMSKAVVALASSETPATGLARVQHFLSAIFAGSDQFMESTEAEKRGASNQSTRFIIQEHEDKKSNTTRRTLGFWKLDNSVDLLELSAQLHCMILTSGTLSPLDHFAAELGVPFGVCLRGEHVIQPSQVLGSILCKGPGGSKLNGGYAFRSSVDYRFSLGMTLVNLSRVTPGGMLVFFPSYAAMNTAVELWRAGTGEAAGTSKTIWGMLAERKPIFVEPVDNANAAVVVSGFQKAVDESPTAGAALLAVCRGKISEGIDFADNHGRCVVVTGIPYANHTDLFVRLKREYLTQVAPERPRVMGQLFTGDDWYRNEAMRAVNQCVGRVIRHRDDYGAVVLADERFAEQMRGLSSWVRERTGVHAEFRESYAAIARFFPAFKSTRQPPRTSPFVVLSSDTEEQQRRRAAVPTSAGMAKQFAEEQVRVAQAEEQRRQRRRLEMMEEQPQTKLCPAQERTADSCAVDDMGSGLSSEKRMAGAGVQKMVKQVLPQQGIASAASSPRDLAIGPTSRDFCTFLKQRLRSCEYEAFKVVLKDIAGVRPALTTSPSKVKEVFISSIDRLKSLFFAASADHHAYLLAEFGRHIPEELRPLYAHLLRKQSNSAANINLCEKSL